MDIFYYKFITIIKIFGSIKQYLLFILSIYIYNKFIIIKKKEKKKKNEYFSVDNDDKYQNYVYIYLFIYFVYYGLKSSSLSKLKLNNNYRPWKYHHFILKNLFNNSF